MIEINETLVNDECTFWFQGYRWKALLCIKQPNTLICKSLWAVISHNRYWTLMWA